MNTPSAPPGITVVIPHLNQHNALARCLAALDAGTRKPVEVIVVDNGSARSPQGVVNDYPWVSLIHQPIPGPGPARNLGAARAQGDVLAFLDADCLPDAHWLAHIAAHMARDPHTILGGDVRIERKGRRLDAVSAYQAIFAYRMDRYIAQQGFTGTGNLIVHRKVFDAVGPFKGLHHAEDRDWGQRATFAGYRIGFAADLVVYHPPHTATGLRLKWDRQLAHDWTRCTGLGGRIRWAIKALLLVPSPLCAVAEVVSSPRIKGARNRLMALIGLTSIRLYRARRMLSLLRGHDPERLLHRWNRIDLP